MAAGGPAGRAAAGRVDPDGCLTGRLESMGLGRSVARRDRLNENLNVSGQLECRPGQTAVLR